MMTESKAKPKAKGTSRASKPRKSATKSKSPPKAGTKAKFSASEAKPVKLLSGGNPQIAKADGDAPVQAYIAAMPGWKRDLGKRLDALIVRNVPNVRKAVKWNTPFYGIEGQAREGVGVPRRSAPTGEFEQFHRSGVVRNGERRDREKEEPHRGEHQGRRSSRRSTGLSTDGAAGVAVGGVDGHAQEEPTDEPPPRRGREVVHQRHA